MSSLLKRNKILFNVHLILSIVFSIPLLIIGVTGAILSYQYELEALINAGSKKVEKTGEMQSIEKILQSFSEQTGAKQPVRLVVPKSDDEAFVVYANRNDAYLVDPYTAQIIGKDRGTSFVLTVMSLHRNLGLALSGNKTAAEVGKQIVGASAVAMILLVISGVWLHFPRLRRKFIEAIKPNFKLKKYALFYNLHTSLGSLSAVIYLLICLTGLNWSYSWYNDAVMKLFVSSQNLPQASAPKAAASKDHAAAPAKEESKKPATYKFSDAQRAYEIFRSSGIEYKEFILMLAAGDKIGVRYYEPDAPATARPKGASVKLKEGKVAEQKQTDGITVGEFKDANYQLHTGYFFGLAGKILWSIVSLCMALFIFSGFYMTVKRAFKSEKLG
ncbi:PepSY-associated TM helix domain-containing protein [Campylobacter gracilis]|uniref:PepSY domain protein n=1 Tax=Campylobacter gracilis RM3268 TaxID=553220 RepID=C8PK02_9BACT|nr:PepSY-associated TM helix domain-containing protein [Campylobacter gracilis]AKT92148.1 putative iron-regulated membrane protein [Campylobacter gracilis]EEV17257.1 PepSY domain protein [Campylobacter gracilis RM3268]UEB45659.1 PepSY domain-containing protein [Campylobacter gracilis]SUW81662.1 putative oxidoreductase [Campylobacter gracilis]